MTSTTPHCMDSKFKNTKDISVVDGTMVSKHVVTARK